MLDRLRARRRLVPPGPAEECEDRRPSPDLEFIDLSETETERKILRVLVRLRPSLGGPSQNVRHVSRWAISEVPLRGHATAASAAAP